MTTAWTLGALCGIALVGAHLSLRTDHGAAAGVCLVLLGAFGTAAVLAAVL